MTRDFDLIRKLLVFFDEKPGPGYVELPVVAGSYTEAQVRYHLLLLHDAGLLQCEPRSQHGRIISVIPFDLTWEGHEFLSKIRSENSWGKLKLLISSASVPMTFDVIHRLATKLALQALDLG
jgi:hypothetical protein